MFMTMPVPGETRVNRATLVVALIAFVAVVVAGVALAISGMDAGSVIALLSGIIGLSGTAVAIFDRLVTVHRVNAVQDEKLDTIEKRVNGELDARMTAAIESALAARFGPAPGPPEDLS